MNYKDVALLDQSFGNLQDSILRNRMLEQQKQDREQDRSFRERELSDREQQTAYEQSPTNPENRQRTAQASLYEDQVKKLGITKMETSWKTADGREMKLTGTADEIKSAMAAAPPSPQTTVKSSFTTKDGVSHTIEGTPEQLKAQQASLAEAGGGIQDNSSLEYKDSKGNLWLRNPKNGDLHPAPQGWETTVEEFDDLGRPTKTKRTPISEGEGTKAPTAPRDPSKRKVGTQYTLPDGKVYTWRTGGWEPIE